MAKTLRLILGDQLNQQHSWFHEKDKSVTYVLMEVRQETDYVKHHIQKVVAFFLAMRQFSEWLQEEGHQVVYFKLDDETNQQSMPENLQNLINDEGFERFEYQLPDEYRLDQQLSDLCEDLSIETEAVDSEHFLVERLFIREFFEGKKQYLMESFYREMRKKYDLLLTDDGKPIGEKWNYDAANRKRFDRKVEVPTPNISSPDVAEIIELLEHKMSKPLETLMRKVFNGPPTERRLCRCWTFSTPNASPISESTKMPWTPIMLFYFIQGFPLR